MNYLEPSISETINLWCPLNAEEYDRVQDMAKTGFPAHEIAVVLQKNTRLFLRDFRTAGTDVFNAYQSGLKEAQELTDLALLENAQKGNLTAKQQMEKKWEEQRLENLRQKIYNNLD